MAVAETARVVLYVLEWVWTVVVLGLIPSQLIQRGQPLADGSGRGDVCSITQTLGTSRCNFGIAWSAIAFAIITVAIAWHCLDYCTPKALPNNVELVIFAWLSLWWFVAGIVFAAVKARNAPKAAHIVMWFSWMLCFMCFGSAVIAVQTATKPSSSAAASRSEEDSMADEEAPY